MEYFDEPTIRSFLHASLSTASYENGSWRNTRNEGGSIEANYIRWLPISDRELAVVEDVQRIRNHPLVSPEVTIHGMLYDVKTGKLSDVTEANRIGRPGQSATSH